MLIKIVKLIEIAIVIINKQIIDCSLPPGTLLHTICNQCLSANKWSNHHNNHHHHHHHDNQHCHDHNHDDHDVNQQGGASKKAALNVLQQTTGARVAPIPGNQQQWLLQWAQVQLHLCIFSLPTHLGLILPQPS